jgi:hypothetical protein
MQVCASNQCVTCAQARRDLCTSELTLHTKAPSPPAQLHRLNSRDTPVRALPSRAHTVSVQPAPKPTSVETARLRHSDTSSPVASDDRPKQTIAILTSSVGGVDDVAVHTRANGGGAAVILHIENTGTNVDTSSTTTATTTKSNGKIRPVQMIATV